MPATLTMKQDGAALGGTVETQIGNGDLSNVRLKENNFEAVLKFNNFGRVIDGTVTGSSEGDQMKGTITLKVEGVPPLPFTGTHKERAAPRAAAIREKPEHEKRLNKKAARWAHTPGGKSQEESNVTHRFPVAALRVTVPNPQMPCSLLLVARIEALIIQRRFSKNHGRVLLIAKSHRERF